MKNFCALFLLILTVSGAVDAAEKRGGRPKLPPSVKLIADIDYAGTGNPRQMLDLILPTEKRDRLLPVVVFVHGGGWKAGHKNSKRQKIIEYPASGQYAGVSIGYRLSGETKWPSQIHDCKAAIRWIRANAEKYGLNPDRIGVWGSSAGGHLVAMLGTSGDVDSMEGKIGPHTDVSSRVTCVVDYYGPTDLLKMNKAAIEGARMDHDAPDSPESLLIGGPIQENREKAATANPIIYVTSDDSSFLIVHGTKDPMVSFNQSELLHSALKDSDVQSTLITVEGGGHGGGFGLEVNKLVKQFFAQHLRGAEGTFVDQTIKAEKRGRTANGR